MRFEKFIRTNQLSRKFYYKKESLFRKHLNNRLTHLNNMIALTKPEYVIDIGANVGQFITDLQIVKYDGKIIAVEPIPEAHKYLSNKFKDDSKVTIVPSALTTGESNKVEMYIASNLGMSSSILKPTRNQRDLEPGINFDLKIEVPSITFRDLAHQFPELSGSRILVKLDVQGYEIEILKMLCVDKFDVVGFIVETSLVELYNNSGKLLETLSLLEQLSQNILDVKMQGYSTSLIGWTYCDVYSVHSRFQDHL